MKLMANLRTQWGLGPGMFNPPSVLGLDHNLQNKLDGLVQVWQSRFPGNANRQAYLDCDAIVDNLGLALPQDVAADLRITSSWPEKAVFSLANRCQWDGVVSPDGKDEDPWGLAEVLTQNRFESEIGQAIASSATYGVSFFATVPGDAASGDPSVLVMPYSALTSAALWDRRRRGLSAGLVINETDYLGRPTELILLDPEWFLTLRYGSKGSGRRDVWYVADKIPHPLRRTPMEPVPYRPNLDRPLGRSRLTKGVLSIIDRALRAAMRMDVSSELFTAPGLLLRGIDEETFSQVHSSWSWRLGSVKGITRDEEGEVPEVDIIPQQSMQPYTEQIRGLAAELAGALSIPVGSLGIVEDNPASAESIYANKEELVVEASNMNTISSYGLSRTYLNVIMLRDGLSEPPVPFIPTHWRNPAMPSIVSQSDAMIKQIQAIPDLAKTDVALEELGYDRQQILRLRAQMNRAGAAETVRSLLRPPAAGTPVTEEGEVMAGDNRGGADVA